MRIDYATILGYFSWTLIFVFVIFLLYQLIPKTKKLIDYFNKKEKIEITGIITETRDIKLPIVNYNYYHGDSTSSAVYFDLNGEPLVTHEYLVEIESNNMISRVNLKKELYDRINENFQAGAKFIKINCTKLVYNGRLDGEEILCF